MDQKKSLARRVSELEERFKEHQISHSVEKSEMEDVLNNISADALNFVPVENCGKRSLKIWTDGTSFYLRDAEGTDHKITIG